MLGLRAKLGLFLGIALVASLCVWWGISQYGKNRVLTERLDVQAVALETTVETIKSNTKADASTRAKRRAQLDSVRAAAIPVEKSIAQNPAPVVDPDFVRVLNDSISAANASTRAARGLPE